MTNAVGLRDQPLRLYQRTEVGTDGYARAAFVFTAWYWGRIDENRAAVLAASERLQMKLDAVAEFADEATVPDKGVLVDPDGYMWWIRGFNSIRLLRRIIVGVDRITEEEVSTFVLFESSETLDGVHLIDPNGGVTS
jgi:hypothetical protein